MHFNSQLLWRCLCIVLFAPPPYYVQADTSASPSPSKRLLDRGLNRYADPVMDLDATTDPKPQVAGSPSQQQKPEGAAERALRTEIAREDESSGAFLALMALVVLGLALYKWQAHKDAMNASLVDCKERLLDPSQEQTIDSKPVGQATTYHQTIVDKCYSTAIGKKQDSPVKPASIEGQYAFSNGSPYQGQLAKETSSKVSTNGAKSKQDAFDDGTPTMTPMSKDDVISPKLPSIGSTGDSSSGVPGSTSFTVPSPEKIPPLPTIPPYPTPLPNTVPLAKASLPIKSADLSPTRTPSWVPKVHPSSPVLQASIRSATETRSGIQASSMNRSLGRGIQTSGGIGGVQTSGVITGSLTGSLTRMDSNSGFQTPSISGYRAPNFTRSISPPVARFTSPPGSPHLSSALLGSLRSVPTQYNQTIQPGLAGQQTQVQSRSIVNVSTRPGSKPSISSQVRR